MSIRDRLLRLAAIKAVKDYVSALEVTEKAGLMEEVGGRMGATAAVLPSGEEAATISISKGRKAAFFVADPKAFLEYVREVRPQAIVETVRESDLKDLLSEAKQEAYLEASGGEPMPGVMLGDPGSPYVAVKQSDEQRQAVIVAWHNGQLSLPDVPGYNKREPVTDWEGNVILP